MNFRILCNHAAEKLIIYYFREKIRWVSIFSKKLIRYYQEEHNLNEWETLKSDAGDNLLSIATIHFAPNNYLREKIRWVNIRYYQEEHNLMIEWMRNTKIESCNHAADNLLSIATIILPPTPSRKSIRWVKHYFLSKNTTTITKIEFCNNAPTTFYRHHPFCPQQYYFFEKKIRWVSRQSTFYRHHPFCPQQYLRKNSLSQHFYGEHYSSYERMNEKH